MMQLQLMERLMIDNEIKIQNALYVDLPRVGTFFPAGVRAFISWLGAWIMNALEIQSLFLKIV